MSTGSRLQPGQYALDTQSGWVRLHTFKEGLLQRMGHDLVLDAKEFSVTLGVTEDGPHTLTLSLVPAQLHVLEPRTLSAKDKAEINRNITKHLPASPQFDGTLTFTDQHRGTAEGQASVGQKGSAFVRFPFVVDGTEVKGQVTLSHKDLSLAPYRAPLGVIRLQDRLVLSFCLDIQDCFTPSDT